MSAFWETLSDANDAAIDTMGEEITLGGELVNGIVEPQSFVEGIAPGGRKTVIECRVMVPAATLLHDGMPAKVRGADGKVASWEMLAAEGHLMVTIGPVNRWSGEIPGV